MTGWKLVRRVGLVVLLAALLYYVVTFVQVWWAARQDDTRRSQAIVVLGAAQYNGRPSPVFKARLDHAATLYHDRVAPLVVVTGGKQTGDMFTEATSGANYLHDKGSERPWRLFVAACVRHLEPLLPVEASLLELRRVCEALAEDRATALMGKG